MNNFIEKNLQKDEKIILLAKTTLLTLLPSLVIHICCILGLIHIFSLDPYYIYIYDGAIPLSVYVIMFIFFGVRTLFEMIKIIIEYFTTALVQTNKRIIGKRGLFTIVTLDSPVNKINDTYVKQTLLGRIFNYGSIVISTSSNRYRFNYLKNANEFKNSIATVSEAKENKNIISEDKYDSLKKIKELKDAGVLTEAEYEKEKEKILK